MTLYVIMEWSVTRDAHPIFAAYTEVEGDTWITLNKEPNCFYSIVKTEFKVFLTDSS